MRWLRGALFADPVVVLATIFFGTVGIIVSFFEKTGVGQIAVARAWARTLLAAGGVRVTVEGLENIQPQGSYVFISNHLSYYDTPVILGHIPVQFRFLAKKGLFDVPFLGAHLARAGHVPVPREDPRAAVRTLQFAADIIQQKKISLLVFPEGGRSRDGILRPFKEGGSFIAIRAGVPLVPTVLVGTRNVLPYGSGIVRSGNVTLRILKPIDTTGMTTKDRVRVTAQIRELIMAELQRAALNDGGDGRVRDRAHAQ